MNNQPGNYYNAPPPTKSSSGGCWKAAGITCGVLLILAVVGVFITVQAVKKGIHNKSGIFGVIGKAMQAEMDGKKIQQAVVNYHTKKGKYPATLTDLVANGDLDGKVLHSEMDPNPNPGHISWVYTKPAEGAPGSTPILTLHYRITMPGGPQGQQSTESDMTINLDGSTPRETSTTTTHYGTQ